MNEARVQRNPRGFLFSVMHGAELDTLFCIEYYINILIGIYKTCRRAGVNAN